MFTEKDRKWNHCLGEILGRYRRRPGTNGKSPFEILFGIRPRFTVEPLRLEVIAFNTTFAREFDVGIAKSVGASRIGPSAPEKWSNKFEVGKKVLVRRTRKKAGSKIKSTASVHSLSKKGIIRGNSCVQTVVEVFDARFTQDD